MGWPVGWCTLEILIYKSCYFLLKLWYIKKSWYGIAVTTELCNACHWGIYSSPQRSRNKKERKNTDSGMKIHTTFSTMKTLRKTTKKSNFLKKELLSFGNFCWIQNSLQLQHLLGAFPCVCQVAVVVAVAGEVKELTPLPGQGACWTDCTCAQSRTDITCPHPK